MKKISRIAKYGILGLIFFADSFASSLNSTSLSLVWGIPFLGVILSLAIFPMVLPSFWHRHFGKIIAGWSLGFLIPFQILYGQEQTFQVVTQTFFLEYLPFVIVIGALFVITGGIRLKTQWQGNPLSNVSILAFGAFLSSWIGTTGASILLIRPLIRANAWRQYSTHIFIFFIFLISNIGGALTPLGDPPLFLGFLQGIPFFWPTQHLFSSTLFLAGTLLIIFYIIDSWFYRKEDLTFLPTFQSARKLVIEGKINFLFLALVLAAVLLSGIWKSTIIFSIWGTPLYLENIVRDLLIISVAVVSFITTKSEIRQENAFSWDPLLEIGKIFLGIFITIIPVISILQAGEKGALGSIVSLVNQEGIPHSRFYFWLTGMFSSVLDNAPTYLVFFHMAGGKSDLLTGALEKTLMAISEGAVFMGALTYIGNAPNFIVRSIVEHHGIKMPHFFRYILWSTSILLPLFALLTFFFF